jgi:hypothetical protein
LPENNFLDRCINELRCSTQLFEINGELAEIFEVLFSELMEYCKKYNIPLQDISGTRNLLNRAEALFNQIAELKANPKSFGIEWLSDDSYHEGLNRRKVTDHRTDEDETEP